MTSTSMTSTKPISSSLALQKTLYQRLNDVSELPAIYDGVPLGAAFPYITLGEDRVFFSGVDSSTQNDHETHIFVYSQHDGLSEVKETLYKIQQELEAKPLILESHQVILMRVSEIRSQRFGDGKSFRGELILRVLTESQAGTQPSTKINVNIDQHEGEDT